MSLSEKRIEYDDTMDYYYPEKDVKEFGSNNWVIRLLSYKEMRDACLKEIDEIIKICELLKNSKHEKWLHINITLKELKQRIKGE